MSTTETILRYTDEENVQPPKGGLSACSGCGDVLALRQVMKALGNKVIILQTPQCLGPALAAPPPLTALSHKGEPIVSLSATFGGAAIMAGGLKSALVARGDTETEVVAMTGDGAAFDIGFGGLSATAERNEDIIYVCYDNEAYMNTGNQRSSATPWGATTYTNPFPRPKAEHKKDLVMILAQHFVPYVATATVAYPDDLMRKVQKAKSIRGFRFLHILCPCPTGWGYHEELTIKISRLAVDTKLFPLYEVEDGSVLTINREPRGTPVEEFVKVQRRFRHLTLEQIGELQKNAENRWNRLKWLASYRPE